MAQITKDMIIGDIIAVHPGTSTTWCLRGCTCSGCTSTV